MIPLVSLLVPTIQSEDSSRPPCAMAASESIATVDQEAATVESTDEARTVPQDDPTVARPHLLTLFYRPDTPAELTDKFPTTRLKKRGRESFVMGRGKDQTTGQNLDVLLNEKHMPRKFTEVWCTMGEDDVPRWFVKNLNDKKVLRLDFNGNKTTVRQNGVQELRDGHKLKLETLVFTVKIEDGDLVDDAEFELEVRAVERNNSSSSSGSFHRQTSSSTDSSGSISSATDLARQMYGGSPMAGQNGLHHHFGHVLPPGGVGHAPGQIPLPGGLGYPYGGQVHSAGGTPAYYPPAATASLSGTGSHVMMGSGHPPPASQYPHHQDFCQQCSHPPMCYHPGYNHAHGNTTPALQPALANHVSGGPGSYPGVGGHASPSPALHPGVGGSVSAGHGHYPGVGSNVSAGPGQYPGVNVPTVPGPYPGVNMPSVLGHYPVVGGNSSTGPGQYTGANVPTGPSPYPGAGSNGSAGPGHYPGVQHHVPAPQAPYPGAGAHAPGSHASNHDYNTGFSFPGGGSGPRAVPGPVPPGQSSAPPANLGSAGQQPLGPPAAHVGTRQQTPVGAGAQTGPSHGLTELTGPYQPISPYMSSDQNTSVKEPVAANTPQSEGHGHQGFTNVPMTYQYPTLFTQEYHNLQSHSSGEFSPGQQQQQHLPSPLRGPLSMPPGRDLPTSHNQPGASSRGDGGLQAAVRSPAVVTQPESARIRNPSGQQPESAVMHNLSGQQPESAVMHNLSGQQPESAVMHNMSGQQPESAVMHNVSGQQPESSSTYNVFRQNPAPTTTHNTPHVQQTQGPQPSVSSSSAVQQHVISPTAHYYSPAGGLPAAPPVTQLSGLTLGAPVQVTAIFPTEAVSATPANSLPSGNSQGPTDSVYFPHTSAAPQAFPVPHPAHVVVTSASAVAGVSGSGQQGGLAIPYPGGGVHAQALPPGVEMAAANFSPSPRQIPPGGSPYPAPQVQQAVNPGNPQSTGAPPAYSSLEGAASNGNQIHLRSHERIAAPTPPSSDFSSEGSYRVQDLQEAWGARHESMGHRRQPQEDDERQPSEHDEQQ